MFNADFAVWAKAIQGVIALILSVAVHEFGHAWAANRLGDSLPRLQGRLTLNPVRHIDPVGTILIPLMLALGSPVPMLGWGRPVQTNPLAYSRRFSRLTGSMLVAIAGPLMNLVLAVAVSIIFVIGVRAGFVPADSLAPLLLDVVALNLSLLFLNLLPIPPLDGGSVLAWALPRSLQGVVDFLARWGFVILLGLVMTRTLRYLMLPAHFVTMRWMGVLTELVGA